MTIQSPPAITQPPSPAPSRTDSANFSARSDAYHAWLPTGYANLVAALTWIAARCDDVFAWALTAQQDRIDAQKAADAVAAQSPITNAAAAAASAQAAAVSAGIAQAVSPDSPVRFNTRSITADLTIASAYNAASVGPITIAPGITVTVQDNATWSIN